MDCPNKLHDHYAHATWRLADVAQSDLEPADLGIARNHRTFAKNERHFCLPVLSSVGVREGFCLGSLAIRCERRPAVGQEWVYPMTLAIVDATVTIDEDDCA
jgi:hypothetical protein